MERVRGDMLITVSAWFELVESVGNKRHGTLLTEVDRKRTANLTTIDEMCRLLGLQSSLDVVKRMWICLMNPDSTWAQFTKLTVCKLLKLGSLNLAGS